MGWKASKYRVFWLCSMMLYLNRFEFDIIKGEKRALNITSGRFTIFSREYIYHIIKPNSLSSLSQLDG